jgi:DNA repair protein RadA/Sms
MSRLKTVYVCEQCAFQSPKWLGRCPGCDAWNSFQEDVVEKSPDKAKAEGRVLSTSPLIHDERLETRINTNIEELNRVLGGGLVKGSLVLLSGEPGIGKSTLTLQICSEISRQNLKVLYVSGEESQHQIASRAKRLGMESTVDFLGETQFDSILPTIESTRPECVIVDSIQVMYSSEVGSLAGSINQVRYCTEKLMEFAKRTATPVILIGHVTKDGNLAGPRVLEHLVDTVLFLEGERYQNLRLLRSMKNRFGPTHEVGIFEMDELGLKEVANPSELFLEGRKKDSFGSTITATVEGTRPLLLEVQALTNVTPFGYPKRAGSGFDNNRLQLLIAVIQKHLHLDLANQDVYVNIVGGFRLNEPAADLAVVMAIISSLTQEPLPAENLYIGEVGLSGELRSVSDLAKRIREAEKLGFTKIYIPKNSSRPDAALSKNDKKTSSIPAEIIQIRDLQELMSKTKAGTRS